LGTSILSVTLILKKSLCGLLFIAITIIPFSELKSQHCADCLIPSFPAITVYQTMHTGPGIGVGVEAGNWKKDAGKFSYFIGTSMTWNNYNLNANSKTDVSQSQMMIHFYVKGQYKITNHLYAIAAPGIVNMSFFELQSGLRYVIPVSHLAGIGIEPAYAFHQQELVMNINLHIALH